MVRTGRILGLMKHLLGPPAVTFGVFTRKARETTRVVAVAWMLRIDGPPVEPDVRQKAHCLSNLLRRIVMRLAQRLEGTCPEGSLVATMRRNVVAYCGWHDVARCQAEGAQGVC